jgi:FkbM family methyltransferase
MQHATHHAIFRKFGPNLGSPPPGFQLEYGGNIVSADILTTGELMTPEGYPVFSEIFEWISLLEAIDDAKDRFVLIELGAGVARWSAAAACVARQYRPDLKVRLIAVEAEPKHFQWMTRNFKDNNIALEPHRLIFGAAGGKDGTARFVSGHAREWYGQALQTVFEGPEGYHYNDRPDAQVIDVPMFTLSSLMRDEGIIDLVHMDVQNAEGEVVKSSASDMTRQVRRAHIATHSQAAEATVYEALWAEGWFCTASYPGHQTNMTPYGELYFDDGLLSWLNPKLF